MFVTFSSLQVLLNILFNIYFIAFLRMGVWGFILAKLIVTSLGTTYLLAVLFRETGLHFAADAAKRIARFSAPLAVSGAAFFVIHFADRFFLNHYATLSEVGVYALAYKFGFLVTYLVGQPIGSVWNVSLYSHVGAEYWRKNFARIAMYLVFFLLLAAVGLGVFIRETLSVIASPAYAPAALLVPVIAFAYAFREVGDFYRGVLFINKRVALFGRITVSCAVLNLILNWALISQYKALGAAWATLLTWAVYMIACWVLAYREHRIPHSAKSFALAFGLAVLVCVSAGYLQVLPIGLRWTGSISLVLLFVSSVWGLGYFDVDERKLILRQLAIGRELLVTFAGRARCLLAP
jgi:O-antigen/teichoic acid export membrane protein